MDDILFTLLEIVSRLDKYNIPYFVSGSMARNLYAEPRFTNDIDIVVELYPKQKSTIMNIFKNDYYISEQQIKDAFNKIGFFNIIHLNKSIKCDLILKKFDAFSDQCFQNRIKETIEHQPVYFISKEDLILQKLLWRLETRSEQQLKDIQSIIENHRPDLDSEYLMKWSKILKIEKALKDLL